MVISIEAEKASDEIQHHSQLKTNNYNKKEPQLLDKGYLKEINANILNGEKSNAVSGIGDETRQSSVTTCFQHCTRGHRQSNKTRKRNNSIKTKVRTLMSSSDDMIMYR